MLAIFRAPFPLIGFPISFDCYNHVVLKLPHNAVGWLWYFPIILTYFFGLILIGCISLRDYLDFGLIMTLIIF